MKTIQIIALSAALAVPLSLWLPSVFAQNTKKGAEALVERSGAQSNRRVSAPAEATPMKCTRQPTARDTATELQTHCTATPEQKQAGRMPANCCQEKAAATTATAEHQH